MDATYELAEQESDEMRQEIDCTRSALADKMEALEHRVMGTVQSAQETVEDSIQMAKDTVATVKRTFDIKHHVEQHPWPMIGGGFLAGLALGKLFQWMGRRFRQTPARLAGNETPLSASPPLSADHSSNDSFAAAAPVRQFSSAPPSRPGFFDRFHVEIVKVKGMAIGYVMGLVRDAIKDAVPQMAAQIDDVMTGLTTKLGGQNQEQRMKNEG
jgi:ElaB/YqjD/DUF883 family membrane-anchored ribosome-binding protein